MTEKICLFNTPFAFCGVDGVTMFFQSGEEFMESGNVRFPISTENSNVVEVTFEVINAANGLFQKLFNRLIFPA